LHKNVKIEQESIVVAAAAYKSSIVLRKNHFKDKKQ